MSGWNYRRERGGRLKLFSIHVSLFMLIVLLALALALVLPLLAGVFGN
jgi:hypothetical protein